MPTYRVTGTIDNIGGVIYQAGQSVVLNPGAQRDQLLAAGVIYRADLPPYKPRIFGGLVQLPCIFDSTPRAWPTPITAWRMVGETAPRNISPDLWARLQAGQAAGNPGPFYIPLNEWELPDNQWPWSGHWHEFPLELLPARGLRPIP